MLRKSHDSPQARRLRSDRAALQALQDESTIFRFRASDSLRHYWIEFRGRSLARERGKVIEQEVHQLEIKLGASYPRTMPELRWVSPIYHPNISEIGLVCLGGYNTHWVPSLQLDELCEMLWDMARYHNYDLRSPYNRDSALWAASQSTFAFPTDHRPLRDLRSSRGRASSPKEPPTAIPEAPILVFEAESDFERVAQPSDHEPPSPPQRRPEPPPDVIFLD